jgi:hypothetical protein
MSVSVGAAARAPRARRDLREAHAEADERTLAGQQRHGERALLVAEETEERRLDGPVLLPRDVHGRIEDDRIRQRADARAAGEHACDLLLLLRERAAVVRPHRRARERHADRHAVGCADERVWEFAAYLRLRRGAGITVDRARSSAARKMQPPLGCRENVMRSPPASGAARRTNFSPDPRAGSIACQSTPRSRSCEASSTPMSQSLRQHAPEF